ncbi:ATP synthase F1 subunit epsilon [Lachnoclostridium sp. An181]|uniref:ATP synthase F1 subunit epsilon n=1 Tax=Lachnoclostridium sp. An181 TaxID=1965575 RepID=UPI000B3733FC|nr:ATP synthase F1 subunit epsilon [Lachnoclostridium sp. An181]OUP48863.1 ATP synthase F1 subunit epsilon [Lachnoclostridium sp. An181]
MSESFNVHILAANHPFYEGECQSLILPTLNGMYGVRAHHRNMITAIVPGELQYQLPGEEKQVASVSAGLAKIENGEVLVLVDSAERPEEIDVNRAKRQADEAKEAILQKKSIQEYRIAQASLARALSRLRVKNRIIK